MRRRFMRLQSRSQQATLYRLERRVCTEQVSKERREFPLQLSKTLVVGLRSLLYTNLIATDEFVDILLMLMLINKSVCHQNNLWSS